MSMTRQNLIVSMSFGID